MNFEKLDRYLDAQLKEGIPGFDIVIYQHGAPIHRYMTGTCDYFQKLPVTENTLYWIYSATKVMTMCAVMQLIEAGKLGLEDKLSDYIPAFAEMRVKTADGGTAPCKTPITIRHLMSMTAGLDYDLDTAAVQEACRVNVSPTTEQIVDAIADRALLFEPGTAFKYSLAHDVLGRVIEVVSGQKFSEYLDTHFWTSLGMTDTSFRYETDPRHGRLAAEFIYDDATHTARPGKFRNFTVPSNSYDSGGGGLATTVADYGKFVGALANKGVSADGVRLLSMDAIDKMRYTQLPEDILATGFSKAKRAQGYSYALGVRCMKYPERSGAKSPVGEFGWDGAANAYVLVDPENELGIFMATQVRTCRYGYDVVHPTIRDLVYEILDL